MKFFSPFASFSSHWKLTEEQLVQVEEGWSHFTHLQLYKCQNLLLIELITLHWIHMQENLYVGGSPDVIYTHHTTPVRLQKRREQTAKDAQEAKKSGIIVIKWLTAICAVQTPEPSCSHDLSAKHKRVETYTRCSLICWHMVLVWKGRHLPQEGLQDEEAWERQRRSRKNTQCKHSSACDM